jgi:hypothetical protein
MLDTCIFDRTGSGAEEIFENRLIQINYPGTCVSMMGETV